MNELHVKKVLEGFPVLSLHCTVTPSVVRGEHWLIVKNTINASHVRLQRELWPALRRLDGSIQLQQWLLEHTPEFGDQRLLGAVMQLQRQGILSSEVVLPEGGSFITRLFAHKNPLMIRCPLFNPTKLLAALCRGSSAMSGQLIRWIFFSVVCLGVYLLLMHWPVVAQQFKSGTVTTYVWHFFLLYPISKAFHELAHGWVLHRYGGQVPEAGVSFVVLFPLPYVDATDAWTLTRKQRMLVTSAGMLMDLFVASVALILWIILSAGVLADMSFSVVLMSMASILVFNANPLLKFDGYYLLEDALDSPGLARRSTLFYQYLFKRYILKVYGSVKPLVVKGEKPFLLAYGLLSPCYRVFISALICVYLISTFHELGVVLSAFSLGPLFGFPVFRSYNYFRNSQELTEQRLRAVGVTASIVIAVIALLLLLPMPSTTRTQGVVWVDEQAEIYAAQSGELETILVENGDIVKKGQPIMILSDFTLDMNLSRKQAAVRLAKLDIERYRQSDLSLAGTARIELSQADVEVGHAQRQIEKLVVRSPKDGRIAFNDEYTSSGQYVSQGALLAYVVNARKRLIRAVVDQSALGRVSGDVGNVSVRLASAMSHNFSASLVRQVPAGTHELPSVALIDMGFGGFDVEQIDAEQGPRTREKVFHLELAIQGDESTPMNVPVGTRAFVTFQHANEPLGPRWFRLGRQLLLKHLNV